MCVGGAGGFVCTCFGGGREPMSVTNNKQHTQQAHMHPYLLDVGLLEVLCCVRGGGGERRRHGG